MNEAVALLRDWRIARGVETPADIAAKSLEVLEGADEAPVTARRATRHDQFDFRALLEVWWVGSR